MAEPNFCAVIVQSSMHTRVFVHKKALTLKKTITFIYRLIGYTFHDIIAIYIIIGKDTIIHLHFYT